jgi:dimeric dUTPase (all-alpha-NTP-PPase superfamily)
MKQQLITMLDMQERMNRKVHPDWIAQNFAWHRALWVECGELMDHWGYKWWKHQRPDHEHVKLEVVDIWHFGMSMWFDGRSGTEQIAGRMMEELANDPPRTLEFREAVEELVAHVLASRRFSVSRFWSLMQAAGMNLDELFAAYIGKNVLNFFRQDHGYKEGSYRKQWQGREDNEHLAEILAGLDGRAANLPEHVYRELAARYARA